MYLVRKCEDWQGRGKCSWKTIFASPDKHGAIAIFKQEFKYVLEADPNLDRKTIDARLSQQYNLNQGVQYWYGSRIESGHGNTGFAIYKSQAAEHQTVPQRPTRTELLNSILG